MAKSKKDKNRLFKITQYALFGATLLMIVLKIFGVLKFSWLIVTAPLTVYYGAALLFAAIVFLIYTLQKLPTNYKIYRLKRKVRKTIERVEMERFITELNIKKKVYDTEVGEFIERELRNQRATGDKGN